MRLFLVIVLFFSSVMFAVPVKKGMHRYIQVLAIRDINRTKEYIQKLEKVGYSYIMRHSKRKDRVYYRLIVGPYFSLNEAKYQQKKVQKLLRIKSSFILSYPSKPGSTVDIDTGEILVSLPSRKKKTKDVVKRITPLIVPKTLARKVESIPLVQVKKVVITTPVKNIEKQVVKKPKPVKVQEKKVLVQKQVKIEQLKPIIKVKQSEPVKVPKKEIVKKVKVAPKPLVKSVKSIIPTNVEKKPELKKMVNHSKKQKTLTSYEKRLNKIVKLSATKDSFLQNESFICSELNKLATKEHPRALLLLSSQYINGDECVKRDYKKAIDLIAEINTYKGTLDRDLSYFSKELLAELYVKNTSYKDYEKAKKLFNELFDYKAESKEYKVYLNKRLGYIAFLEKDYKSMNKWLKNAANLDDKESQLNLAKNYYIGLGIKQNLPKAITWFKKCYEKQPECAEKLGDIYLDVSKIKPDPNKAFIYYEKANELGSNRAKKIVKNKVNIKKLYELMQQDTVQSALVYQYLYKYVQGGVINEFKVSNLEQKGAQQIAYVSYSMYYNTNVGRMVLEKNQFNYWVPISFKSGKTILELSKD